jgi:hypothetical protein
MMEGWWREEGCWRFISQKIIEICFPPRHACQRSYSARELKHPSVRESRRRLKWGDHNRKSQILKGDDHKRMEGVLDKKFYNILIIPMNNYLWMYSTMYKRYLTSKDQIKYAPACHQCEAARRRMLPCIARKISIRLTL